jgi:putative aldouronate transport system permease protein
MGNEAQRNAASVLDARIAPPMRHTSRFSIHVRRIWKFRAFYLMLLPGLIWYLIFRYLPMYGVVIAFKDFNPSQGILGSPPADPWYKHFAIFFRSPYFTQLLANTFIISLSKIAFGMFPPLILALLLNECRAGWFRRWVQTLSYMPHFLSWVIIYGILLALFGQTSGLINRWIIDAGGRAIPFLTSPDYFRGVVVLSDIWQNLGWGAIIYLAAIAGIDPALYEAGRVDGANRLQLIWNITIPGIRNVFILLLILRVGYILDAGFEQIYILYNPQVYRVADILDTWVFRTGLEQLNFSLAAAVGLFKSVIGMLLVITANHLAKRWEGGIW